MNDTLLSKPILPSESIDCSMGEPHIVREILFNTFDMKDWKLPTPEHCWEYPSSAGYQPLVHLLEWKHQAKVIITNGAKQAIGAYFNLLREGGWKRCAMKSPYWTRIPPLAKIHGIESILQEESLEDPFLLLAPNNPDGFLSSSEKITNLWKEYKKNSVPFAHDAAYYKHSYIPRSYDLSNIGDIQIYSLSKMLGLSNLRIGYVVCHNENYYNLIKEYVETMTVGVSLPAQIFAYDILNQMRGYPTLVEEFEDKVFDYLKNNKKIISQVDPEVLEVPNNYSDSIGMFGWFKKGSKFNQEKIKINFIDGKFFGDERFVRLNLAFNESIIQEIVNRLNLSIKE